MQRLFVRDNDEKLLPYDVISLWRFCQLDDLHPVSFFLEYIHEIQVSKTPYGEFSLEEVGLILSSL